MPNLRVAEVERRLLFRGSVGQGMVRRVRLAPPKNISIQSVDFKPQHSAKTGQAWRYPKNRVVRAPSTILGSNTYEDPKSPGEPRRKQESNFFITINTNKTSDDAAIQQTIYDRLKEVLKHISKEHVIATYIKFGPKDAVYQNDKFGDVISSLNWSSNVEEGDVLKRVHAHIWLTIGHYSQVQINVQMLMHIVKAEYNKGLGIGGMLSSKSPQRMTRQPYVHVKLLPQSDWTDVMRQYIHKGMTA